MVTSDKTQAILKTERDPKRRVPLHGIRTLLAFLVFGWLSTAAAQAQDFSPIPPLYFTKTAYAATNPLPQTLTVTSTGANFNFTGAASTSTGGSWLAISGLSYSSGTTPQVVTVTVSPAQTLAPGTYTGQILFSSGAKSLIVPVYLSVTPTNSAFFDNLPGQLGFALKKGGVTIASQKIQVRNAGSGSLPWSAVVTTADNGAWLVPGITSGTAPSYVVVAINLANLPGGGAVAGTYTGQLKFVSATGNVTIPISVLVGDNVFDQINPISFTKIYGGVDPLPQVLTVASTGANFNFSGTASTAIGGSWFGISGLSYGSGTTPSVVTVTIAAALALPIGTYTGQIVFSTGSAAITVPVSLTVAAATDPVFDNMTGQLSFPIQRTYASSPSQAVDVRNAGQGSLNWSLTIMTADGGNWLSASVPSGTAPSGPISISVSVANLPFGGNISGVYIGQLLFQSDGNSITIPVSAIVDDNTFRPITPLSFSKVYQGADPLLQTLTVASTGATNFGFTAYAYTANGGNWLSVAGLSYSSGKTPQVIFAVVAADAALAVGSYTGEIVVVSTPNSSSNIQEAALTIPVTLNVRLSTTPVFDNLPGQISFSLKTNTGSPVSQSLSIRNAGSGTLSWTSTATTSDGGNWLSISANSGTAPSTVNVSLNAANLPYGGLVPGTFTGMITFVSANGSISVPVSVFVGASVFVQAAPLTFNKAIGATTNPTPQTFTVASTGTNFNFSAYASSANGGNWLSISGLSYSSGTTPQVVTVSANPAASLAAGTYTGQILVYTSAMAMTIPITLNIGPVKPPILVTSKVGFYNSGTWAIDANGNGLWDGTPLDKYFSFTPLPGDIPVVGDWTGDGYAKAGIYRNGFWILDVNNNGVYDPGVDKFFAFGGNAGEIPIVGDWNGDGKTKIGYYLHGFWVLDYNGNGQFDGIAIDRFYALGGNPGEIPVVGDWSGDGKTKVGYFLNGTWVLDYNGNGQWDGATLDRLYAYTNVAIDKPVVGDWTGDGKTKIGVYRGGFWVLDWNGNGVYDSGVDKFYAFGGNPGEVPLIGDWNGDGKSKVGYFNHGFWALDNNGNGQWDGAAIDRFIALGGSPGDQPIVGKW